MSATILTTTTNLTAAQIASLVESPVTVVPAPGSGFYIIVHNFVFEYVFNTTPYIVSAQDQLVLGTVNQINNEGSYQVAIPETGFIDQSSSQVLGFGGISLNYTTGLSLAVSDADNQPLVVSATADPASGDGTITVTVFYTVEPIL